MSLVGNLPGRGYCSTVAQWENKAGESTLSEIVSLYIVFSHLLIIVIVYYCTKRSCACAQVCEETSFLGVAGDGPASTTRQITRTMSPAPASETFEYIPRQQARKRCSRRAGKCRAGPWPECTEPRGPLSRRAHIILYGTSPQ